jgi:hypothetical protein
MVGVEGHPACAVDGRGERRFAALPTSSRGFLLDRPKIWGLNLVTRWQRMAPAVPAAETGSGQDEGRRPPIRPNVGAASVGSKLNAMSEWAVLPAYLFGAERRRRFHGRDFWPAR